VFSLLIAMALPRSAVLTLHVPLSSNEPITLSEPFQISNTTHALEIEASTPTALNNAWIGLDIALIDDTTGASEELGLELSHASGYDGGEYWVESSPAAQGEIGSVARGRYVLRVEPHTEHSGALPSEVLVRLRHGVFLWFPFLLAFALLAVPALLLRFLAWRFEVRRWQDSDHPMIKPSQEE
jgi:hypothetical protein